MCAILGWAGAIDPFILRYMFRNGSPWGPHSVGLAYYDDEQQLKLWKKAITPQKFLRNHNRRLNKAAEYGIGIGHLRAATTGPINDKCAHPFVYGGVCYVHNGIMPMWWKERAPRGAQVDSEMLGPAISNGTLNNTGGSVGLAWLVDGQLYAYRNRFKELHFTTLTTTSGKATLVATRPEQLFMFGEVVKLQPNIIYKIEPAGPIDLACGWAARPNVVTETCHHYQTLRVHSQAQPQLSLPLTPEVK